MEYTEENLAKAIEYQRGLEADMGGTEMLLPLEFIFQTPLTGDRAKWRREVIFLTDGGVYNQTEVSPWGFNIDNCIELRR